MCCAIPGLGKCSREFLWAVKTMDHPGMSSGLSWGSGEKKTSSKNL